MRRELRACCAGLLALALYLVPAVASADSASWPQIGYDAGHAGVNPDESLLSPRSVGGLREAWRAAVSGQPGLGGVSVDAGRVFVASAGAGHRGSLLVFDAASGQKRWRATLDGFSLSVPAIADGLVVTTGGTRVWAFDEAHGDLRWSTAPARPGDSFQYGDIIAPTIADGRVYASSDLDGLAAYDLASGRRLGPVAAGGTYGRTATVSDGVALLGWGAADALSGARLWSVGHMDTVVVWPAVAPPGGGFVLGGLTAGFANVQSLSATGDPRWVAVVDAPAGQAGLVPMAATRRVVFASLRSEQASGVVALALRSGKPRWTFPLDGVVGLCEANGVVYASARDGLYAIDARSGGLLVRVPSETPLTSPPVVAGGSVYVTIEHGVAAYRLAGS